MSPPCFTSRSGAEFLRVASNRHVRTKSALSFNFLQSWSISFLIAFMLMPVFRPGAEAAYRVNIIEDATVSDAPAGQAIRVGFSRALQYLSHYPKTSGKILRIRLSPLTSLAESGYSPGYREERRALIGGSTLAEIGLEVDSDKEAVLVFVFSKTLDYRVQASSDRRSLEVILLPGDTGTDAVGSAERGQGAEPVGTGTDIYAINLAWSQEQFKPSDVPAMSHLQNVRFYTNRFKIQASIWNRLSLGFFPSRQAAQEVAESLRDMFPRVLVTRVSPEEVERSARYEILPAESSATLGVSAGEQEAITDMTRERVASLMTEAGKAMASGDYWRAIQLYKKVVGFPDADLQREAGELLALAYERDGRLEYARSAYEEYLRQYPEGPEAERARARLEGIDQAMGAGPGGEVDISHTYAINLQSSLDEFNDSNVHRLKAFEGYRLYTTRFKYEGRVWHRLRLGFFPTSEAAEKILNELRNEFPRAWVTRVSKAERIRSAERMLEFEPAAAEAEIGEMEAAPPAMPEEPGEEVWPALSEEKLAALMEEADAAMTAGEYSRAVQLYTKVLRYPGHKYRQRAQELLALARERKGQLAHARAEYEEYLRLYPEGEDAERVRQRLAALLTARATPKEKLRKAEKEKSRTDIYGSFSQFFDRSASFRDVSGERLDQHSLNNDLDLTIRHRGEAIEMRSLFSGGYTFNFLDNGGDDSRISYLYADMLHRNLKLSGRIGRQSTTGKGGILGRFDGAVAGYQIFPKLKANIVGGFPVESSRDVELDTSRRFLGVNFDLGTFAEAWESNVFFINQEVDGITDRRAVGGEVRYFKNMLSVFSSVDYDLSYSALISAILVGTYIFEDRSTLNLQLSYRKTPVLSTSNGLIGQVGVVSISELLATNSEDEIRTWAEDRSADFWNASVNASHWITDNLQISGDFSASETRSTPASGGVDRIPGTGVDFSSGIDITGSSLIKENDIAILRLAYFRTSTDNLMASLNTRYPFNRNWRINPRASLTYSLEDKAGKEQLQFKGSIRTDYRWKRRLSLELEVGFEWSDLTDLNASSEAKGYFLRAGYRLDF